MNITKISKQLGRGGAVCGLILIWMCLSGCRTQSQRQHFADLPQDLASASGAAPAGVSSGAVSAAAVATVTTVPKATGHSVSAPEPEVFRVGDSLTIVYSDLPQITPAFEGKIKEDGTVTLLLNKAFAAAGKTAGELEAEIRAYYVPRYYKYMTVNVRTVQDTRWYYVYGEVKVPNRQIYTSRLTVLQAVASAGGFTDFANKKKVKLTRVDGRSQVVNCPKAQDNPALDVEVYPGDKIYVPRRVW